MREYNSGASKEDFLTYMEARIDERYYRNQISFNTYKGHRSSLNKLREYVAFSKRPIRNHTSKARTLGLDHHLEESTLPFYSLTYKLSHDFNSWLKTDQQSCLNTCSKRHRNIKTYLELARRDKIVFEDPYQYFTNTMVQGKWKAMTEAELTLLERHYEALPIGSTHRRMLQKFLFNCHCGLRLGDLKQMGKVQVEGQRMALKPHNIYRYDE